MATVNKAAMNETGFNKALKQISTAADVLAQTIHDAGMFALRQVNEHGNANFGSRLFEAMGKKHDRQRVVNWLCHFGKFSVKDGTLVYRARRDISAETIDKFLADAEAKPYWELTPEKPIKYHVDYLAMLRSIVTKHTNMQAKAQEGKDVSEDNLSVLAEVQKLLNKFDKKPAEPVLESGAPMIQG